MVYNFAVIFALLFHVALCAVVTIRSPASVSQIMHQINTATQSRGGVYADYSCKTVSWDDSDRGTVDGQLSVWGASITDTRLWAKDGTLLFTVRPDNWDEKLGHVEAKDIKLIASEYGANGEHETITLEQFLQNAGKYGGYAGLPADSSLANPNLDSKVSVRFQTTFLPVADEENSKIEFATDAYNYNTISDNDPKNLVVLATSQGIAVQQDGEGAKKLYHHLVDIGDGLITRHWLEAERTQHNVGGAQNESCAEAAEAAKRGKAQAEAIGIPAMGKRFNVLMTVQIPLKQSHPNAGWGWQYPAYASLAANEGSHWNLTAYGTEQYPAYATLAANEGSHWNLTAYGTAQYPAYAPLVANEGTLSNLNAGGAAQYPAYAPLAANEGSQSNLNSGWAAQYPAYAPLAANGGVHSNPNPGWDDQWFSPEQFPSEPVASEEMQMWVARSSAVEMGVGESSAARASVGSVVDTWDGLTVEDPQRSPDQHVTVTIQLYNTVAGGVPSEEDIVAAIDDMEKLYKACNWSGHLSEQGADFMKNELTNETMGAILGKIVNQPYGGQGATALPIEAPQ